MAQLTSIEVQQIQAYLQTLPYRRIRIIEGLRLLLEKITKERGYSQTVKEVSYDVKSWRDKSTPQTPVIYLIGGPQQKVSHAGCIREFTWRISMFGVCREMSMVDFETYLGDIQTHIFHNNTLFGQAAKVEVDDIDKDNQLFSELDGTHLYELTAQVEYTRKAREV